MSSDKPEWFAPKRYGYGAGLPISWQGWAVTIGFLALLALASLLLLPDNWVGYLSVVATITAIFVAITAKTTRGGWRWRWGEDD